jgi:hypothetical protein
MPRAYEHRMEGEVAAESDRMEQLPAETAAEPGVPREVTLDPNGERVGEAEPLAQSIAVDEAEGVEVDTVGHDVHLFPEALFAEKARVVGPAHDERAGGAIRVPLHGARGCNLRAPRVHHAKEGRGRVTGVDDELRRRRSEPSAEQWRTCEVDFIHDRRAPGGLREAPSIGEPAPLSEEHVDVEPVERGRDPRRAHLRGRALGTVRDQRDLLHAVVTSSRVPHGAQ